MSVFRFRTAATLLAASALAPLAAAQAADCTGGGAQALTIGTVAAVAPGAARTYSVSLGAGDSVIVDLANLKPVAAPAAHGDDDEHGDGDKPPPPHSLKLCSAGGALLAPQPGEVFEKGGSLASTADGERLRFTARTAGQYLIAVTADDAAREILVRQRKGGGVQSAVVAAALDGIKQGTASSSAPVVFTFAGTAGQWVELKSTSEKDTLLRLAGPDREGAYSVIAENDDTDGLNPVIKRKLPVTGTYYLQVDSLAAEAGEFELTLKRTSAPKPPPPPLPLQVGTQITGKLDGEKDVKLYTLSVVAGHSYRLELTASYDGVVAVGLPNPLEPDSGNEADAGFAEAKSQDSGTSGTERLNFTARTSGQLLVRVKSFGIGETDGSYTLKSIDLGG